MPPPGGEDGTQPATLQQDKRDALILDSGPSFLPQTSEHIDFMWSCVIVSVCLISPVILGVLSVPSLQQLTVHSRKEF